jgi:DNA-binding response OmpR family regulator
MQTVLIIDDDEKLIDLVRDYLTPHGYEVRAAYDGPSGLRLLEETGTDLVVLDVMLPGMDGFEVCRKIRASSDVPVLMLTARGDETDRIVGLEIGADDYLPKPFNPRELLARMKAIFRRATPRAPSADDAGKIVVGPVSLDPSTRQAVVRGREVLLTTAEFDMLLVLARAAGRVLSRDQLMADLHGTSWSYFDRSIDVHVSRIRGKIEHDPHKPVLLRTIRGVGYQFVKLPPGEDL